MLIIVLKKIKTSIANVKHKFNKTLEKSRTIIKDKSGQGTLDTAISVLISIVLGALILGGLYLLLQGTVLPTITRKITEIFNYSRS